MDIALAGGGGGGGGALAFPVDQGGAEGQVAVAGGGGEEGFDLGALWINPGQRLSSGRIVIEQLQKGVSKAGEVTMNGIPQNQLIDGFIHVDNSIACSNNAAQIRNDVEQVGISFRSSFKGFSDNLKLTFHG